MKIAHDIGEYGAKVAGLMELFLLPSGLFISLTQDVIQVVPSDRSPNYRKKKKKKTHFGELMMMVWATMHVNTNHVKV